MDILKELMTIKTDGLFAVILGASGSGKSRLLGTLPGKTLYLYGSTEGHGVASAAQVNKELLPIAWDRTKNEVGQIVEVAPEKLIKRIKDILDPAALVKLGVKTVALDSWTALAQDLKATPQFKQRVTDPKSGKLNAFKETEALIELMSGVIRDLQTINDVYQIDVVTTLDLQIQAIGEDGTILESKPSLPTFGTARAVVQAFADILVLGRIGEKRIPVLQNFAMVAASSVDRETKVMCKYIEFNPRLRGVAVMPEVIEADLKKILSLKK